MNSKNNFFHWIQFTTYGVVMLAIVSFFLPVAIAATNDYQLNQIAQSNNPSITSSGWQQLVANPSNQQQHFIIDTAGQMTLIDSMDNAHVIFNLNATKKTTTEPIQLTAIALHPNFSLRDQLGYNTFYTAHIESLDQQSKVKRIQERSSGFSLTHDAVITQWKFTDASYKKVDLTTKREVLRIAVPDLSIKIQQMAFNPYKKAWNEDFGLLYIALNGQEKWQKPLYSGVILRINPAKFGLRNFTVPSNNPFSNVDSISNELYLLGGQNIKQFIWPDKNKDALLLSHYYQNKSVLTLTTGGDDWRNKAPSTVLYQTDSAIMDLLSYQGRSLPLLRNKLLLLKQTKQHWLIESISLNLAFNQGTLIERESQLVWRFPEQHVNAGSDISITTNVDDELLLINKTAGVVFQLFQENNGEILPAEKNTNAGTLQTDEGSTSYFLLIIFAIVAIGFFMFKRLQFSAKAVVRKQFAQLKLSDSQQQVALYHRHQNTADTIINFSDLVSCEVLLNNHSISTINHTAGYGFDDDKEQGLRALFAKEKITKMVDGKARQISLLLCDSHDKSYTVCLYMRKGSDRITKKTYTVVIDDVVDWCWLIAEKINSKETATRPIKPTIETQAASEQKAQQQMPLHDQAAAIRPTKAERVILSDNSVSTATTSENNTSAAKASEAVNKTSGEGHHNSTINTELVNALEKLVNLKQQGFLTQDEFAKAKEKLLQSLLNE